MQKGARGRRGFTLIETVVTVGIIATLAAVVVPQVVRQFDATEPTRIQNDLKNLQTAIETFNVNMSGVLPGDLEDLVNQPTTADDTTLVAIAPQAEYTTVAAWKGPYADITLAPDLDTDAFKVTGNGAQVLDNFVCYNATANTHGISEATGAAAMDDVSCANAAGQKFLAIQISGLAAAVTDANFVSLNELFDGVGEASPGNNGRIRFDDALDIVYFLVLTIN